MKIAHFVSVAPNRCGLYGTAKDLLKAEQKAGLDAGIVDADIIKGDIAVNGQIEGYPKLKDDIVRHSYEWGKRADILIRHSLIPVGLQNIGKPLVMAMHGRPESSFRLEQAKVIPVISQFYKRGIDKRYKGFICFWPEYMLEWSLLVPTEKLFYIPAPIDTNVYKPEGEKADLKEHSGSPNILVADIWRDDIIPFNVIFAAVRFQQKYCKTAKIHILALQGENLKIMSHFLAKIKAVGALGVISPMTTKITNFYRAADMVITPHTIATRTVREPLACGVPVVAGSGNRYTPYTANYLDTESFADAINKCWQDVKADKKAVSEISRKMAIKYFGLERTGKIAKEVYERILK